MNEFIGFKKKRLEEIDVKLSNRSYFKRLLHTFIVYSTMHVHADSV